MFGALYFGSAPFAGTSGVAARLVAAGAITFSADASLTTTARLAAAGSITFSSAAAITVQIDLVGVPGSTIQWSSSATLSSPFGTTITIGGVPVTGRVRLNGLTIHDILNDAPNTASLTLEGDPPALGQPIRITLGTAPGRVLFAGSIQTIDQSYESLPQYRAWSITAIDDTGLANSKRPFGTWINYAADVIANYNTVNYAPGFSSAGIAPNLPVVTIVFDGSETFIGCLSRLATAIGGYCKIEDAVVYLFLDDTTAPPDPLDVAHPPLNSPPITINTDVSQLRTRVYGKGYGETIRADLNPGATLIPIQDGVTFPPAGGLAIAGTSPDAAQSLKLAYTGVALQGGGTLVGPGAAPGVAPLLQLAVGSGVTTGAHSVALVFVTVNGKTLPGPPATIEVGMLAGPATALTAGTPLPGTGPDEGYHDYLVTFVTDYGETTSGALSNYVFCSASVGQLAPPPSPSAGAATAGLGPDPGSHDYAVTFVNSEGETTGSAGSNGVATSSSGGELPSPGSGGTAGAPQIGVGVDNGTHTYYVTFVNANGETPAGPGSNAVSTYFGGEISGPGAPTAGTPTQGAGVTDGSHSYGVTFVNAYGETMIAAWGNSVTTQAKLTGQTSPVTPPNSPGNLNGAYGGALNGNQTYYYALTFTTTAGESLPSSASNRATRDDVDPPTSLAGQAIQTNASGGTLTPGTTYYYRQTFVTPQGESLPSPLPGGVLLSAGNNAFNVYLHSSNDARVTQYRLYRRAGSGGSDTLVTTVSSIASPILDKGQSAGGAPPTVETTHETAMTLTIPTSGDPRVTGRKIYRSIAGETSARHLLATISNNSATAYTDLVADLTIQSAAAPPTSDSTATPGTLQPFNVVQVTGIATGPAGVTARKLYRWRNGESLGKLVATFTDNTTTAYSDTMPDANRGPDNPSSNTTGTYYQRVPVTGIPIGPAGVTARKLYRYSFGATAGLVAQLSGNSTTAYTDSTPNNALGPAPPTSNSTGEPYRTVPVSDIALGPAGTTGRRLYRRFNGAGPFKQVVSLTNNTATMYTDTKANSSLGVDLPATNTTGTAVQKVPLTEIPLGPLGVTARKIYRKFNFSSTAQLVTTLANNTATTFTDQVPNSALGALYTGVNTAIGNQIKVTTIPLGAQAVTSREIYMSLAGGGVRHLALVIPDNVTREATITASDATLAGTVVEPINDLSGLQQPVGQVNPGATAIPLAAATTFLPQGGWVLLAGGQCVFYSGISGQTLVGIPASGSGAITTTILYGSQALPSPMLLGVTGVTIPMLKGSAVHIWVQRDDLQAQAEERARTGNDGIIEYLITDQRRGQDSLIERCDADLALFSRPITTVAYACRDLKTKSGKPIRVTLPGFTVPDPLVIQDVTITEIDLASNLPPRFTVRASSVRFSLEDVLRRMIAAENKGLR